MEGEWAAEQGLEPQLPDPESGVLPLDDSAMASTLVIRTTLKYAASYSRAQAASQGNYQGCPRSPAAAGLGIVKGRILTCAGMTDGAG